MFKGVRFEQVTKKVKNLKNEGRCNFFYGFIRVWWLLGGGGVGVT